MAAPRAFDHDELKHLWHEHPDWNGFQFAHALTETIRQDEPDAPMIKIDTVYSCISKNRAAWSEELGTPADVRAVVLEEVAPPPGTLAGQYKMATEMRYLRELAKAARGEEAQSDSEAVLRRSALNWADRMRANLTLVDLTAAGRPVVRHARPEELNSLGELITLAAWKVPGWRQPARV